MIRSPKLTAILAAAVASMAGVATTRAVPVYAIGADNGPTSLFRFDSATPGTIVSGTSITGLQAGENLVGIDFRPANGLLYGIGSTSRVYSINTTTGAATAAGGGVQFTPLLNGVNFDIDFNPTVDRIRLVSDADQNLRLNPDTGSVVAVDGTLAYAAGDPNAAKNPNVAGAAYTSNGNGASTTTLYAIDSGTDTLDIQNANVGSLTTVGSLGIDVTALLGFDIYTVGANNFAVAQMQTTGTTNSKFYTINLTTGAATAVGEIGGGFVVRDIAVAIPEPATLGVAGIGLAGLMLRRRKH